MNATSALSEPPDRGLGQFPSAARVPELHRLSVHRTPWYYHSSDPGDAGGGRFDLPRPNGTCHTGETLDAALVEKLLRIPARVPRLVSSAELVKLRHTIAISTGSGPATADATSPTASGFGINAELAAGLDYGTPRRWAAALHGAGWRAVRHRLRNDPSGSAAGRALFGATGPHRRAPAGWRTTTRSLDVDEAASNLEARGVRVAPVPTAVAFLPPP